MIEEKMALVTLRPGWRLPWLSTGDRMRMREKEFHFGAGLGECAEHRTGDAAQFWGEGEGRPLRGGSVHLGVERAVGVGTP